jgi:diguanylate cyclase (GGDEF)-like protein
MVAVTVSVHALLVGRFPPVLDRAIVPVGVLALAFVATEGFTVHLRVRRGGHAIGLSEIPMVLGLFSIDPVMLLVSRVVGGGVGLALLRRQRGLKLAFNVALLGVQTTVAVLVFHAVAGGPAGAGPREWIGTYAAMIAADVVSGVLVTAAIALRDDPDEWRRLPSALRGVPFIAVTTSIALVGTLALQYDRRATALLGAVTFVTFLAFRSYVRQSQGHAQVEDLYAFTRALGTETDPERVARIVLDQARDQLRAEVAELVVPGDDDRYTRLRMSGQGNVTAMLVDGVSADDWWAPAARGEAVLATSADNGGRSDGIAVPVPMGDSMGVLLVADSLPDVPSFDTGHVRLFQALANHASVSLAKARLVDRLRQEVSEKEHLALHDPLTGLPNRRQFNALLERALLERGTMTAVMLMDLDRFKEVNDALGHDTGDALLREVGVRLQRRLGERGIVARLGGDEFAVLLPKVGSTDEAVAVGEALTRELDRPIVVGHLTLDTRASLGVAVAPDHGDDATTLLRRADVAMYAAKGSGSGGQIYRPQDDRHTPQRLALIADLRQAIQRRELTVVFQPKIDPVTAKVTGAEALVRWMHPTLGPIGPDEFIPLAEHSGLIRPLTLHVLEVSLRRCAQWRRDGHDLHVAVNLSPNSLLDVQLPEIVEKLLGRTGVPPAALTLEITETSIMADPAGSLRVLDRLNRLGVKLAIDDFGTGYSSLGRLRELPIHEVKIDKSFVQRISVDHRDRAVVRSAVQLGHALDLEVVAEGVEDGDTYSHLTQEGCNIVQGYFVSRPLPPEEFTAWLNDRAAAPPKVRLAPFGLVGG